MAEAFASGVVPFAIVLAMALEALVLAAVFFRTGQGIAPRVLVPNLMSGACLMGAAGLALRGAAWPWVGGLLAGAGVLHGIDLWQRWGAGSNRKAPQ